MRALIQASADAGMNMLRIWGGGLYESEHFYNVCDELGILVWQDFPYACAYYPDRGEYAESAKAEAIAAVRRLRVHPSLAIWCGNNENDQMYHDGWGGKKPPRFLGEAIYHDILPAVVAAEDPQRPYWPSSPYGGDNPNAQPIGDCHDWNVWHGVGDWVHYPQNDARFLSEFGFASSCGLATWDACLAEMDREPNSLVVRWHDKTRKGYDTYMSYIRLHYPAPQTLTDLVYYSQINQADALKCGIEHWRRRKGHCWGTLFWQLNDCWPVQSWAVIDSEGEPKAAYYAAKRFYAPVLLSLRREGETVEAHLTNDLLRPIAGSVTFRIQTFEGETLLEETARAAVGANGSAKIESFSLEAAKGKEAGVYVYAEFIPDADTDAPDAVNFLLLAEPKALRLPDPEVTVDVQPNDRESFLVTLKAKKFAPYVWLRLKGQREWIGKMEWSDNFFHLRPGDSQEVVLYTSSLLETPEEARTRLEVRTL
jgi:beta-mannosidase